MASKKGPNSEELIPSFATMGSEDIVHWLRERVHSLPNGSLSKAVELAVAKIHDHHYNEAAELLARLTKDRLERGTGRAF